MPPSGTALAPRSSRRWWYAGGAVVVLAVAVLVALFVVYPRVGAATVRAKLTTSLGARLGREVTVGAVDVALGHAVIRDLEIRGPRDGKAPLVKIARIDIDFDTWASFTGTAKLGAAKIDGVDVTVTRSAEGDNVRDMLDTLRGRGDAGASGGERSPRPTSIVVENIRVRADDAVTGAVAQIEKGQATWRPGELRATLEGATATTSGAPKARAASITISKIGEAPPQIAIAGGEIETIPKLALSGIEGTLSASSTPGTYTIDLAGGYGGVPGKLWTAKGSVDPRARTGTLDLVAAKFQLDRLAPLLEHSPVVDYQATSLDTKLHLALANTTITFAGELALRGLNVGHPLIADTEVHDLDLAGKVDGTFDLATRTLELTRGEYLSRGVPFSITGRVRQLGSAQLAKVAEEPKVLDQKSGEPIRRVGPANLEELVVRVVVPPIDCQRFLTAIPPEMVPYMQGYKLKGVFDTDVTISIDWRNLDATRLDGHVGIKKCKVVDEPGDGPKRLLEEFDHYVEVEEGEWLSFVVGPTNPDFVPLADISPYLVGSIQTTEDAGFYKHRGFIVSEFRSALVSNLKVGKFRHGASSITMQFVKNVLLYREKTLLRKLQELFLTWHVENTLEKDRILEIYFNVIEYGPGLYGIGPAAKHFFGKPAKDLTPSEAAFFSSILPSPKERYKQYCQGTLTKWTTAKVGRILALMHKRGRLTQEEYDAAKDQPLLFVKDPDDSETVDDCMKRVKKAIKNARSTNPLAPPRPGKEPDPSKGKDRGKDKDKDKRSKPPTGAATSPSRP